MLGETQDKLSKIIFGRILPSISPTSVLPRDVATARFDIVGKKGAELKRVQNNILKISKVIDEIAEKQTINSSQIDATEARKIELKNQIEDYLFSKKKPTLSSELSDPKYGLIDTLNDARKQIDDLSERIIKSDFVQLGSLKKLFKDPEGVTRDLKEEIKKGFGSYKRTSYKVFEEPDKHEYKNLSDATKQLIIKGFKRNKKHTLGILKENNIPVADVAADITDDQAVEAAQLFLKKYQDQMKNFSNRTQNPGARANEVTLAKDRIKTDMFIEDRNLQPHIKALLGEIRDPLYNYTKTVDDLSSFLATDDLFRTIRNNSDPGFKDLFINPTSITDAQKNALLTRQESPYVELGSRQGNSKGLDKAEAPDSSGWGSLHGYLVPERVYQDLTVTLRNHGLLGNTYGYFLRAKGASQLAKTAFSIPTQARNVISGALFALAQGNVGRGVNVFESLEKTFANIPSFRKGETSKQKFDEYLNKLTRLGVTGTSPQFREAIENFSLNINNGNYKTTKIIDDGTGTTREVEVPAFGTSTSDFLGNFTDKIQKGKYTSSISKVAKKGFDIGTDLYQSGDDIWKIYNFEFEKKKLLNAFTKGGERQTEELVAYLKRKGFNLPGADARVQLNPSAVRKEVDDLVDQYAADIVKNTVPNYNMAPDAIKLGRKLPLGNFITFPYEIIRTGLNTIKRSLDELTDESPQIREIGLRRLTGTITANLGIGAGLTFVGHNLTDVTDDEVDAYRKALAPPWEKNSRLIPTGRNEDGTFSYVNFSYFNPYDLVSSMATAALGKTSGYSEARALGKNRATAAFNSAVDAGSVFLNPFVSESIITEKLADTTVRGGRTKTGAKVFDQQDTVGDKITKSFFHTLNGVLPGIFPGQFSTSIPGRLPLVGDLPASFEQSGFLRSFTSQILPDTISKKDRNDIERKIGQEVFNLFTGVTEREAQIPRALTYKGYEFSKNRQDASNSFNRVARKRNVTSSELLSAFRIADEKRYRAFNQFKYVLDNAETLNLSKREIKKILKQAGVFGVDEILRGRYEPLKISSSVLKQMRRQGTIGELPRAEIKRYRRERSKLELTPGIDVLSPSFSTPVNPNLNIDLDLIPLPTTPSPSVALGTQVTTAPSIDREALAGGNPATQQIARR